MSRRGQLARPAPARCVCRCLASEPRTCALLSATRRDGGAGRARQLDRASARSKARAGGAGGLCRAGRSPAGDRAAPRGCRWEWPRGRDYCCGPGTVSWGQFWRRRRQCEAGDRVRPSGQDGAGDSFAGVAGPISGDGSTTCPQIRLTQSYRSAGANRVPNYVPNSANLRQTQRTSTNPNAGRPRQKPR